MRETRPQPGEARLATPAPPPRMPVHTLDPRTGGRADRAGKRTAMTGRANSISRSPASESSAAADLKEAACVVAAVPVLRAELVSVGRPDPDGQRSGPDDHPDRLIPGRNGGVANTFPGPPPGTGIPSVNGMTSVLRISDAIFVTDGRARVLAANQAGLRTATNDAMLGDCRGLFRPPGRKRAAGHRPRGRRQRRGPLGDHQRLRQARDRAWRPTIAGH